jgi:hypothetical protein
MTGAVQQLVDAELGRIADSALRDALRTYLVVPERHERDWEYAATEVRYPCWLVASCPVDDWCIVYCEHGFGPEDPWGMLQLSNERMLSDACWHVSLEHAFRMSPAWAGRNPPDYEVP